MVSINYLVSKIASKIDDKYYSNQQDITEYVEQAKKIHKDETEWQISKAIALYLEGHSFSEVIQKLKNLNKMKGTLHKSMNYGWMVQDGVDSFYPIHPYDIFTNSIERIEGKEVDFILQDFWDIGLDEKLIKVAIISAKIVDVPQQDEIQCNYCSKVVKNFMAIDVWMITDDNKNVCYECQMKNHIGYGEVWRKKIT